MAENDSQLNLLQYVSGFRNKLSKASEVARSNLKNAQGKKKERYDQTTQDRSFEPGETVLALLSTIPALRPLKHVKVLR